VNVEPQNSRWYRSQVTNEELIQVRGNTGAGQHLYRAIDYDRESSVGGRQRPILAMLDRENNIAHSDLNAIVIRDDRKNGRESAGCTGAAYGSSCNRPFREFTVIFHDEVLRSKPSPNWPTRTVP
jgi:hypothetical protein